MDRIIYHHTGESDHGASNNSSGSLYRFYRDDCDCHLFEVSGRTNRCGFQQRLFSRRWRPLLGFCGGLYHAHELKHGSACGHERQPDGAVGLVGVCRRSRPYHPRESLLARLLPQQLHNND